MKIGICDDRYEIRHKVKEILQETYTEEQGFLIHSYTPNEIKIDIEDMVYGLSRERLAGGGNCQADQCSISIL